MTVKSKTIVRVSKRENPYVTLDKFFFNDERLSWKAKGLLGYLLSKPNDWKIILADLIKKATDGRDSIYTGLKELERAGYLERKKKHNDLGRFDGYEYVIYERPQEIHTKEAVEQPYPEKPETVEPYAENPDMDKPHPEKPYTEKPYTGKPYPENPTLLNNDITNNDLTNKRQQQNKVLEFKVIDHKELDLDNKPSVVVSDTSNQSIRRILEAFWRIAERRESDYKFIKKLLASHGEQEILEEIRKIDQTYADKSTIKEPKALLIAALRTRFDDPGSRRADVSGQVDKLRQLLKEVSAKRFGLSFDAKLQLLAEMGHRFSPKAVETVRDEYIALNDKYKDVYR